MISSQWFHSLSTGSKTEDALERVEVHEETEEMESVLVTDEGGMAIMFLSKES